MINFKINNEIAYIELDDGKANVFSPDMIAAVNNALDEAQQNAKAVVISAGGKMFSAGYDLAIIAQGAQAKWEMVLGGFDLLMRLYTFPMPVIAAIQGHALGMGAFICLVSDTKVAADGDYKIGLPETAGNMEFGDFLIKLIKAHLSPAFITKAALQSQMCNGKSAVDAGFVDLVVPQDQLSITADKVAEGLKQLPSKQYAFNKLALRSDTISALQACLAGLKKEHLGA